MVSQFRTGANLVVSQIQEIGNPYKEQKREIYRKEEISQENGSVVDMCPTEKSSQMEPLKLKFFHLPALEIH